MRIIQYDLIANSANLYNRIEQVCDKLCIKTHNNIHVFNIYCYIVMRDSALGPTMYTFKKRVSHMRSGDLPP